MTTSREAPLTGEPQAVDNSTTGRSTATGTATTFSPGTWPELPNSDSRGVRPIAAIALMCHNIIAKGHGSQMTARDLALEIESVLPAEERMGLLAAEYERGWRDGAKSNHPDVVWIVRSDAYDIEAVFRDRDAAQAYVADTASEGDRAMCRRSVQKRELQ